MAASEQSIEMAAMGPGGGESKSALAAPASGASKSVPTATGAIAVLSAQDKHALQKLEDQITLLGHKRQTLDDLRRTHSTKHGGRLADSHFRRGTSSHHEKLAKDLRTSNRFTHVIRGNVPLKEIALAHEAIANSIGGVKAAHHALSKTHPWLAWKTGKFNKKNRKFLTPSGVPQSLGHYHGKNITDDGTPKTFGKGGRKTRKHRRKHRRKTRKHRRKHRRKHKTKRRKNHRRKHKRKTRRR